MKVGDIIEVNGRSVVVTHVSGANYSYAPAKKKVEEAPDDTSLDDIEGEIKEALG